METELLTQKTFDDEQIFSYQTTYLYNQIIGIITEFDSKYDIQAIGKKLPLAEIKKSFTSNLTFEPDQINLKTLFEV